MRPIVGICMRSNIDQKERALQYMFERVRLPLKEFDVILLPIPYVQKQNIWYTKGKELSFLSKEEKEEICFFLDQCDGLFLPGGDKFVEQDRFLFEEARKRHLPTLACCLGMQAAASIGQEVKLEEITSEIRHKRRKDCKYAHTVEVVEGSLLYEIVGKKKLKVNSFHARKVEPNPIFQISAKSPDGVIEAIELAEDMFFLGVQWHPELMEYDLDAKKILKAFYDAVCMYQKANEKIRKEVI